MTQDPVTFVRLFNDMTVACVVYCLEADKIVSAGVVEGGYTRSLLRQFK